LLCLMAVRRHSPRPFPRWAGSSPPSPGSDVPAQGRPFPPPRPEGDPPSLRQRTFSPPPSPPTHGFLKKSFRPLSFAAAAFKHPQPLFFFLTLSDKLSFRVTLCPLDGRKASSPVFTVANSSFLLFAWILFFSSDASCFFKAATSHDSCEIHFFFPPGPPFHTTVSPSAAPTP